MALAMVVLPDPPIPHIPIIHRLQCNDFQYIQSPFPRDTLIQCLNAANSYHHKISIMPSRWMSCFTKIKSQPEHMLHSLKRKNEGFICLPELFDIHLDKILFTFQLFSWIAFKCSFFKRFSIQSISLIMCRSIWPKVSWLSMIFSSWRRQ